MLEVTVAPDEDKDALWELFLEYAQELSQFDSEKRPRTQRHYTYFDQFWKDQNSLPFEIRYDHEIIGLCFLKDTGFNYKIVDFYIRPLHRRRGFGTFAVDQIKEYCANLGRHAIVEADIYINNDCAVQFWKSVGFSDTGRRFRIKDLRLMETEATLARAE